MVSGIEAKCSGCARVFYDVHKRRRGKQGHAEKIDRRAKGIGLLAHGGHQVFQGGRIMGNLQQAEQAQDAQPAQVDVGQEQREQ
jgi:hypothetical protein